MMREKLIGIDLNDDGSQGKNLIKIDEHGELRNYGFNTFDYLQI